MGERICSIDGCNRPVRYKERQLCGMHYQRWRKTGSFILRSRKTPLRERLLSRAVIRDNGCVEWTGSLASRGYGRISLNGSHGGTDLVPAHRVMYEMFVGPIPEGTEIDHLCRNTSCVAPIHLEAVTHRENVLRGESPVAKFAAQQKCVRGHPLDAANTIYIQGGRRCRECCRIRDRRRHSGWSRQRAAEREVTI